MSLVSATRRANSVVTWSNRFSNHLAGSRSVSHAVEAPPLHFDVTSLDKPQVYVSTSHDPWFNLSYEEWLFRNTPVTTPILFFYRNIPSVVIGKNQNPWKETTPAVLAAEGIPLVRRRSGGGAVFHDLGNTNFSFLIPRNLFSRSLGAEIVANALEYGMHLSGAKVNERGDLVLVDPADGGQRKISPPFTPFILNTQSLNLHCRFFTCGSHISGSAYKIVSQRAYHHGTMLISSDLTNLGRFLRSKTPQMNTKGVDSVRSPVANLIGIRRDITQDEFVHQVANSFQHVFSTGDLSVDSFQQFLKNKPVPDVQVAEVDQGRVLGAGDERAGKIRADMEGLKTWEWTFGQTPEFSITLVDKFSFGDIKVHITSKHAVITHCVIETSAVNQGLQRTMAELQSKLVGQRYDDTPPISNAGDRTGSTIESEIRAWLRRSV